MEGGVEEALVIWWKLLSNLSVVVLLCWLGTMRAHVEDMFTVRKSGRGGRSGRESKRRRGGGRKETVGEMTTRVCVFIERKRGGRIPKGRLGETEEGDK